MGDRKYNMKKFLDGRNHVPGKLSEVRLTSTCGQLQLLHMFILTCQSGFSSGLLMQASGIVPVDCAFSHIRNHIHKFILNCDARVPSV